MKRYGTVFASHTRGFPIFAQCLCASTSQYTIYATTCVVVPLTCVDYVGMVLNWHNEDFREISFVFFSPLFIRIGFIVFWKIVVFRDEGGAKSTTTHNILVAYCSLQIKSALTYSHHHSCTPSNLLFLFAEKEQRRPSRRVSCWCRWWCKIIQ